MQRGAEGAACGGLCSHHHQSARPCDQDATTSISATLSSTRAQGKTRRREPAASINRHILLFIRAADPVAAINRHWIEVGIEADFGLGQMDGHVATSRMSQKLLHVLHIACRLTLGGKLL